MFCTEETVLSEKMREIKIRPEPISNVSCYNENVWESKIISLEGVVKAAILAFIAIATLIANLTFVLVLRSNKYHRHVHVQVIHNSNVS